MATQLLPSIQSHRLQLIATALLSGVGAAALLLGYQNLAREERIHDLKASVPSLDEPHDLKKVSFLVSGILYMCSELRLCSAKQLRCLFFCHPRGQGGYPKQGSCTSSASW